jgi:hypothetical protein
LDTFFGASLRLFLADFVAEVRCCEPRSVIHRR